MVHRFPDIRVPTLLMIGAKDVTTIGKDMAPPDVAAKLGHYAELAPAVQRAIPNAKLITFPQLGHAPQMSDPDAFHRALLEGLRYD